MPAPPPIAKYDALIDLVVKALVRDIVDHGVAIVPGGQTATETANLLDGIPPDKAIE